MLIDAAVTLPCKWVVVIYNPTRSVRSAFYVVVWFTKPFSRIVSGSDGMREGE